MEFIMDLFNQIGKMTSDLANGIVKETGKVLNDAGKIAGDVTNNIAGVTGDVARNIGKFVGEVSNNVIKTSSDVVQNTGKFVGEVTDNVVKVTGDVVTETGKIAGNVVNQVGKSANNIKEQVNSVDLFNDKLRRKAVDEFNQSVSKYELKSKELIHSSNELYNVREEAVEVVGILEKRISELANSPKEFKTNLQMIKHEIHNFQDKKDQIKKAEFDAKAAGGSSAATASLSALGVAVATLGPTAAMGIATTFGVASTGTAISSLSGAAASNAALAWLGGGALAAGGGGMSAGNGLLALAGPVGWTIAGLMLTASIGAGVYANFKNDEAIKEATEQRKKVEFLIKSTQKSNEEIKKMIEFTKKQILELSELNKNFTGNDYSLFTDNEKYLAGILVNSTLSLAQLVNKEIVIDENK